MTHDEFRDKWGFPVRVAQRGYGQLLFKAKCLPASHQCWHGLRSRGWATSRKKAVASLDNKLSRYFMPRPLPRLG